MKTFILWLISVYQRTISPHIQEGNCKFYPTCSEYSRQAIEKHGATKGGFYAIRRILRCHPFRKHTIEHIP